MTLDGEPVEGVDDLVRLLEAGRIGKQIEIWFVRADAEHRVNLRPDERRIGP